MSGFRKQAVGVMGGLLGLGLGWALGLAGLSPLWANDEAIPLPPSPSASATAGQQAKASEAQHSFLYYVLHPFRHRNAPAPSQMEPRPSEAVFFIPMPEPLPRLNPEEQRILAIIESDNPAIPPHQAYPLAQLILEKSLKYGLDPKLVASLVSVESSFRFAAVSATGAKGLGQLTDATAKWLEVSNPFDPADNLEGCTRYMSQLYDQFEPDWALALGSYNVGPGTVRRQGLTPTAKHYVNKIDQVYTRFP